MTEEKATCGQCMKWIAFYRSGTGGCRADVPAWAKNLMGKQDFLVGANTVNEDSAFAEECELFNPKKG